MNGIRMKFQKWKEDQYIKLIDYLSKKLTTVNITIIYKKIQRTLEEENFQNFKKYGDVNYSQIKLDEKIKGETWGRPVNLDLINNLNNKPSYKKNHNKRCYKKKEKSKIIDK